MRRLLIAVYILALSVLPAYAQQPATTNPALDPLRSQVFGQPDDFGVACMPLAHPEATVSYHAETPFPLASVAKLMIFIELARRVEAGLLSPDEVVSLDALNLYDLPRSNSDAHERFLSRYPAGTQSLSLWEIAAVGMIQYSSNAASDYLLDRLGPTDWGGLYDLLGMTHTDPPHAMGAIALIMANHESGRATPSRLKNLSLERGEALFDLYLEDAAWHRAEVAYRADRRSLFPGWEVQAMILDRLTASGTASDFLRVMQAIYAPGGPLSARVKQLVRDGLRWRNNSYVDSMYLEYGSKLGFYSGGVLALVAYGHPYTGDPVISVTFLRNIPRQVYNEMQRQDSIGELAHWMNLNGCANLLDGLFAGLPDAP